MIHGEYCPATMSASATVDGHWQTSLAAGRLTAEQVLQHYCRLVYDQCGSYEQAAQRLGLDRRTVKRKLEELSALEAEN